MLKKLFATGFAALAGIMLLVPASEARTLDEIIKAGVIRVGVQPNLPGNSVLKPDGSWEGMDIEMGWAIAKSLGVKAEFVPSKSPQRVPILVSDQADIMLG